MLEQTSASLGATKTLALVAHDNMKTALSDWAWQHRDTLSQHSLMATGTTGYVLENRLDVGVDKLVSGPLGGDQQIGSRIAEGKVDMLIFFWDPFEPMPHDPDVKALLRIAAVWNIPVACNAASADFLLSSTLMNTTYSRAIPDYARYLKERTQK